MEDVTEIILNLKQVRFKRQIEGTDSETVSLTVAGQDKLTGGDIGKFTSAFQVLNPEHVICNMESSVRIEMELTINKGRGYAPAEKKIRRQQRLSELYLLILFLRYRKCSIHNR